MSGEEKSKVVRGRVTGNWREAEREMGHLMKNSTAEAFLSAVDSRSSVYFSRSYILLFLPSFISSPF